MTAAPRPAASAEGEAATRGRPRRASADVAALRAFFEVVAESGYAGATMDAIAARAGVAKTTIYRRWPTKEDLMAAALRLLEQEHPDPDTGTLRGDLRAFVGEVVRAIGQPPMSRFAAAMIGEMARNVAVAQLFRQSFLEGRFVLIQAICARAQARGELAADVDARLCAQMLVGPLIVHVVVAGLPLDEPFAQSVVDTLLEGIERR